MTDHTVSAVLDQSVQARPLRPESRAVMAQVGWVTNRGVVCALDDEPCDGVTVSYAPLYIQIGTWVEIEPGRWGIEE